MHFTNVLLELNCESTNLSETFRKSRTAIYTPADPPMMPADLSQSTLLSAFDGARLVYFDGISTENALFVAQEVILIIPLLVFFYFFIIPEDCM